MLHSRRSAGPGRFLEWKIRLFALAAVLLLVGMARDLELLVILAIALLAVAFALRFLEREPAGAAEEDAGKDEDRGERGWVEGDRPEGGGDGPRPVSPRDDPRRADDGEPR